MKENKQDLVFLGFMCLLLFILLGFNYSSLREKSVEIKSLKQERDSLVEVIKIKEELQYYNYNHSQIK